MTDRVARFVRRNCALASLAYAAHMKRLGHGYYGVAVAAVYTISEETKIIYSGPMPSNAWLASQPKIEEIL